MPVVDKPLKQLIEYTTCNPKPSDFDVFWDRGLRELDELDSQVSCTAVDFSASYATCHSMFFSGIGGARVHARIASPITPAQQAVLIDAGVFAATLCPFFGGATNCL